MKCSIIPCPGLCRHDSPFHLCEACYVERRRNGTIYRKRDGDLLWMEDGQPVSRWNTHTLTEEALP